MPPKNTTATTATAPAQDFNLNVSADTLALANDLKKFVGENKLVSDVQGKQYVQVEAWQYAGSRLGIVPIVEHVINVSSEAEIKYQAKVTLFDLRSQHTVGAGFAICSNKESGKKFYQEFAIASMAQTRAVGKAYRNILAWIIRAAGYEPTPAEEMEYTGNVPTPVAAPALPPAPQPTGNGDGSATPSGPPAMHAASSSAAPAGSAGAARSGDVLAASQPPVQYATVSQKEEIIRLLNHPLITRPEKTKMLLNINRLDEERATQAIAKLRKAIEDREGTTSVAA